MARLSAGLPIVLRIAGEPVILIGDGEMADAKRRALERAGAVVVGEEAEARFGWIALWGEKADAAAARLRTRGILINVADRPDLCDFTMPAIVDRDPVLVAVSTGGASAGLAAALRQRLEALLPMRLGGLADALYAGREALKARYPDFDERRRAIGAGLAPGGTIDALGEDAAERVDAWLGTAAEPARSALVTIRLRSSDPEELTLREARLLALADRVWHRPDVPGAILVRARGDAARIACDGPPADPGAGFALYLEMAE
jgi:uroporphyrin-III C-methyltransferase/precorrin-2 dehydrogenase/sirohydrochlorin ferrochelatase